MQSNHNDFIPSHLRGIDWTTINNIVWGGGNYDQAAYIVPQELAMFENSSLNILMAQQPAGRILTDQVYGISTENDRESSLAASVSPSSDGTQSDSTADDMDADEENDMTESADPKVKFGESQTSLQMDPISLPSTMANMDRIDSVINQILSLIPVQFQEVITKAAEPVADTEATSIYRPLGLAPDADSPTKTQHSFQRNGISTMSDRESSLAASVSSSSDGTQSDSTTDDMDADEENDTTESADPEVKMENPQTSLQANPISLSQTMASMDRIDSFLNQILLFTPGQFQEAITKAAETMAATSSTSATSRKRRRNSPTGTQKTSRHVCTICGFTCRFKFHFNSHMNTHQERQCSMCDFVSRLEWKIKRHMMECHTNEEKLKLLEEKGSSNKGNSNGAFSMASILGTTNSSTAEEPTTSNLLSTLVQSGPNFASAVETVFNGNVPPRKRRRSGQPRFYACQRCEHRSTSQNEQWEHLRTHILPEKQLNCEQCNFVTDRRENLTCHHLSHTGGKPHQCDKCSYKCVSRSMLNSHMRSHSNHYGFKCMDCNYETKYSQNLKNHLKKYNHRSASGGTDMNEAVIVRPIVNVK